MTVFIHTAADLPTIIVASFDWSTCTVKRATEEIKPGMTYFVGGDGAAYDYVRNECWEMIANFATDSECASVIIIPEGTEPSEDDLRAFDAAVKERELHADCFGN